MSFSIQCTPQRELAESVKREKEELARRKVEEVKRRAIKERKKAIRKDPEIWTKVFSFLSPLEILNGCVCCRTFARVLPSVITVLPLRPASMAKSDITEFRLGRFPSVEVLRSTFTKTLYYCILVIIVEHFF